MMQDATPQTAKGKEQSLVVKSEPFAGAYTFKQLIVWQRAQDLAEAIIAAVDSFPNTRAAGVIAQQTVRSSTSTAANIAEGHARFVAGPYRNHLSIARGSTAETMSWLDLMRRRKLITGARED